MVTAKEYGTLAEISTNAGRVLTYDRLLRRVWGLRGSGDSWRVRTATKQLRRKLGDDANDPTYIISDLSTFIGHENPQTHRILAKVRYLVHTEPRHADGSCFTDWVIAGGRYPEDYEVRPGVYVETKDNDDRLVENATITSEQVASSLLDEFFFRGAA